MSNRDPQTLARDGGYEGHWGVAYYRGPKHASEDGVPFFAVYESWYSRWIWKRGFTRTEQGAHVCIRQFIPDHEAVVWRLTND